MNKRNIFCAILIISVCAVALLSSLNKKTVSQENLSRVELKFIEKFEELHKNQEYEKIFNELVYTEGASTEMIHNFKSLLIPFINSKSIILEIKKIPSNKNSNKISSQGYSFTVTPTHYLNITSAHHENKNDTLKVLAGQINGSLKICVLKKIL